MAFAVFRKEPSAFDMVALVEKALLRFGKPRVLISDKGSVFCSTLFESALKTLGIEHRFGAVGRHGSISTLERLWGSVKTALHVKALQKDLVLADLLALTRKRGNPDRSRLAGPVLTTQVGER